MPIPVLARSVSSESNMSEVSLADLEGAGGPIDAVESLDLERFKQFASPPAVALTKSGR